MSSGRSVARRRALLRSSMIGIDGVSSTQMGALARWFTAASSLRLSCSLRCADLIRGESTPLSMLNSREANCSADISRLNTAHRNRGDRIDRRDKALPDSGTLSNAALAGELAREPEDG